MAAYGALTSLMHIIQQIQQHPHPPISLEKQSLESLTENISFLQEFLEDYSHVSQDLESRIADAAYSAEDIIESHVVDQIHVGSLNRGKRISSVMDSIKKEVIRDKPDQLHKIPSAGLSRSSAGPKSSCTAMVGFDEVLYQVKDKLTGGESKLQIIPIVGMGGIGKTTLARNVYADPVLDRYFDILAWVTVSQEWAMREILLQLLKEEGENLSKLDDGELGERLYRRLFDRKYLIIMDDIWDIKVLGKLNFFFPNNNNGSRLVLTTRMYNLTCQIPSCVGIELNFLNEDDGWELFCKNAFGKEADRSAEIEVIGKKIVRSCKGLPLSIVVIGGLLSRSQQTLEHWEHVAENLNSIVNLENDEHCLQILYMSYNSLPVRLKSCFLYMGVFPEDSEISVSELIKLWVVEGFIRPVDGKSLEEVAKECLDELIDRNLVVVEMVRLLGKIKSIKIHDLLLDLCLREAKKHKFLCLVRGTGDGIHTERRICTRRSVPTEKHPLQVVQALESASLARSLTWQFQEAIPASGLRLLRVYSTTDRSRDIDEQVDSVEAVFRRVNLRYIYVNVGANVSGIPSSISLLWNLQTLIVDVSLFNEVTAPSEIWGMTQLRHVDCMALRLRIRRAVTRACWRACTRSG